MADTINSVKENILNTLATYNCLWTLAAISSEEYNSNSYRDGPNALNKVIFSSAGRYGEKRVPTVDGIPEFFINNVEIKTFVGPSAPAGNTNQQLITFELFEPYSMGLFLQSLQTAAKNANYISYMQDAPYVLRLDIEGQSTINSFKSLGPWYFCLRVLEIMWSANESGSKYYVKMFPYNDQVFNQSSNTLFNDVKLIGKGSYEALVGHPTNSLLVMLNNREQQLVKSGVKKIPDKYEIQFPDADWGDPNPYKADNDTGSFEFEVASLGGITSFKRYLDVVSGDKILRDRMTIDPRETSLLISQDSSITNIIDLVILSTKHARETADQKRESADGMNPWWKILPEIIIGENDPTQNAHAKTYIYKIVPYKVHKSHFQTPNTAAPGLERLKNDIVKQYYYLYSGLNTEVLKWELVFKSLHVIGVAPNSLASSGSNATSGITASVSAPIYGSSTSAGAVALTSPSAIERGVKISNSVTTGVAAGGSGRLDTAQQVANQMYANILKMNGDMTILNLEILGDPYWLPVAGHPNYSPPGNGKMENKDNTMNYINREVCVQMEFRTPQDSFDGTGFYKFQNAGIAGAFSGVYLITGVTSKWNDGNFTQELTGTIVYGQDIQPDPTAPLPVTTLSTQIPERSALFSSTYYG